MTVLTHAAPFTASKPVRFTHTDPGGQVFFPRYFEMFQAVVEDWFTKGLKVDYAGMVMKERLGLPTAHTECDFLLPCRLGEIIDFAVILEKIGRSSIHIVFDGSVGGEKRLRAKSVLVVIGLDTGKPQPISAALREKLEAYQSGDLDNDEEASEDG